MAFVTLEDLQGAIEITVFPNLWNKVKGWLKTNAIALVEGKAEYVGTTPRVLADAISPELTPSGSVKLMRPAGRATQPSPPAVPAAAPGATLAPEMAAMDPTGEPDPDWDNVPPPEPLGEAAPGAGAGGSTSPSATLTPTAPASGTVIAE